MDEGWGLRILTVYAPLFCFYGELQFIVCKIARRHTSRGKNWGELRGEMLLNGFYALIVNTNMQNSKGFLDLRLTNWE